MPNVGLISMPNYRTLGFTIPGKRDIRYPQGPARLLCRALISRGQRGRSFACERHWRFYRTWAPRPSRAGHTSISERLSFVVAAEAIVPAGFSYSLGPPAAKAKLKAKL